MPLTLHGPDVQTAKALAIKIGSGAVAAIIVTGRRFHRQVHQAKLLVHGHLRPDAGVAGVFGRAVLPGLVTGFALHGNGVEDPEALAGAHVEAAYVALVIAHGA